MGESLNHWLSPEGEEQKRLCKRRYEAAARYTYGTVIDFACGYGYGSSILLPNCSCLIGIDKNQECIDSCKKRFIEQEDKTCFLCSEIKTEFWAHGDWLVCLETLEHLENPEEFLYTASAGISNIILSFPSWKTTHRNKYHKHDLTINILSDWFKSFNDQWEIVNKEVFYGIDKDRHRIAMAYSLSCWSKASEE